MENIGTFLSGCEDYGLKKTDLFQTVDLYEAQNILLIRGSAGNSIHEVALTLATSSGHW